jgi:hypothetical protein
MRKLLALIAILGLTSTAGIGLSACKKKVDDNKEQVIVTPTDPDTGNETDPSTGGETDPGTGGQTDPGTGGQTDPGNGGQTDPGTPATTVTSVTLSETAVSLLVGGTTYQLFATVNGENNPAQTCVWTTSDATVVSVNPNTGYINTIKVGTATITATSTVDSTKKATCVVTVTAPKLPSAPTNFNVDITFNSTATANFSWETPESLGDGDLIRYEISINDGETYPYGAMSKLTFYTSIPNGKTYKFKVRAVTSAGNGEPSSTVEKEVFTLPSMPANISAEKLGTDAVDGVKVSWGMLYQDFTQKTFEISFNQNFSGKIYETQDMFYEFSPTEYEYYGVTAEIYVRTKNEKGASGFAKYTYTGSPMLAASNFIDKVFMNADKTQKIEIVISDTNDAQIITTLYFFQNDEWVVGYTRTSSKYSYYSLYFGDMNEIKGHYNNLDTMFLDVKNGSQTVTVAYFIQA